MQKALKIVRVRLKESAALPADSHPDADVLTAFTEHSLAGSERDLVIEHLARCGDCRDVVTLALPAMEVSAVPASGRKRRIHRLAWPMLRWGALAAGIVAVSWVGVVQYSQHRQEKMVASNLPPHDSTTSSDTAAQNRQSLSAAAPAVVRPAEKLRDKRSDKDALAVSRAEAVMSGKPSAPNPGAAGSQGFVPQGSGGDVTRSTHASASHGALGGAGSGLGGGVYRAPGSDAAQALQAQKAAPAPLGNPIPEMHEEVQVGASSEVVEVTGAAPAINTESAQVSAQNQIAQREKDLPLQGRNVTDLDVVKAKNPVAGPVGPSKASTAPAPSGISPQTSAAFVRAWPRWGVSSAGALQRSFDGGKTWEMVNPGADSAPALSHQTAPGAAGASEMAVDDKAARLKKNGKAEALPTPNPIFRAVAAAGLEVWAGGSGGALYHSGDGGNRWNPVEPMAAGAILAGDVTSIQFSDAQHGIVATANGEVWTTADGGQSWQKRQ